MKPASPPLSPQPAICQPAGSPGYLLTRQPIRARAPLVIPSCLCSPRVFLAFSLGFPRAHVPVALMFPSCRLPAVCQPYSTPFGRQRVGQCGGNLISPRGQPESQPVSLIASLLDMQVASQPICQLANLPVSQFGRSKNETTTLFHIGGKGLAYTASSHQPIRNPVCQAANLPGSQFASQPAVVSRTIRLVSKPSKNETTTRHYPGGKCSAHNGYKTDHASCTNGRARIAES